MAYRTIILFLLSTFFQNICLSQGNGPDLLKVLESKVDSVIRSSIASEAFPGCVVYAAHAGEPILFKSYGYHTYDSLHLVSQTDLYDLASITKVMGATLAIMKLYEDGLIRLDDPLNEYIDGLWWRKIGRTTIRECLAHQAGLKSWIKFYEEIQRRPGVYKNKTIAIAPSDAYPFQITEGMYLHKDFYRKIKRMIRREAVYKDQSYVYSGLFFYLVPELVRNLTGMEYEAYLQTHFYTPLQLNTMGFNPHKRFSYSDIVPTEIDSFFRFEPIHGKVHDEGAILMNGVSGNAGLFANAVDVARVWHMLLNDGRFDGQQYLKPQTIQLFTTTQYPNNKNRRALGFDKPLLEYDSLISSVARSVSFKSYGHSGYTGTLVWADPETDLLFVFLSNRVYPTRDQRAIYQLNVRPTIHQLLYEYIADVEKYELFGTFWMYRCWF